MVLRYRTVVICCLLSSLWGQTKTPALNQSTNNVQLQKQLAALQTQVVAIQQKISTLETSLKFDDYLLSTKQDRHDSVTLNLTDRTFQRLDTDTGFFLVSVNEVVPYLNGYKLRLKIGNPSAADYAGAKVSVKWNTQYSYDKYTEASFQEWQKAGQEKDISLTDTLTSGSWNNVELILAPATTEQLGLVTLTMSADTVRLTAK